jgi:cation diffusion facilitator CzcD-associated flavoprotein CzcO
VCILAIDAGSGAMSMGFVDVLLQETDATIAIVDRGAAPGGHWNHAYAFLRLHQPAPRYGLAARAAASSMAPTSRPPAPSPIGAASRSRPL